VLVQVFDKHGPRAFLTLADALLAAHIEGAAICWALEYAKDLDAMQRLVVARDQGLLQYLTDYAKFHYSFAGMLGIERTMR
jgi:hypothetical protein